MQHPSVKKSVGDRTTAGRAAESLASRSLEAIGWRVVSRNLRLGRLEVDLLARDPAGVLVAVEVRRRRTLGAASPWELLGARKFQALRRQREGLPSGCRIDLLFVIGAPGQERIRLVRGIAEAVRRSCYDSSAPGSGVRLG